MAKSSVLYNYDSNRDGQVAANSELVSPWFDMSDLGTLLIQAIIVSGGTFSFYLDTGYDGANAITTKTLTNVSGSAVREDVAYSFARLRVANGSAPTLDVQLAAKGLAK